MKQEFWSLIKVLIVFGVLVSCKSEYTKMVENERSLEVRNDSIFNGVYFGQPKKEFHDYHWELNKKGLVTQGPRNMNVQYILKAQDSLSSDIHLLYYPDFSVSDSVREITGLIYYAGWAPWNEKYHSDQLIIAMKDTLVNWFGGNEFVKIESEANIWAKVDGNRRVALFRSTSQDVKFTITDLTFKK